MFLLTAVFALVSEAAIAQEDKPNAIQLRWGIARMGRQDLVFSPFRHTGFSPLNIGFSYLRSGKLYHGAHVDYTGISLAQHESFKYLDDGEEKTSAPHSATLINLNYELGAKLKHQGKRTCYLGGATDFAIQSLNYQYGRIGSFGYYAAFSLHVWYRTSFLFGEKHRLSGQIAIPLMTWLARSPYLVNDDEFIENTESHKGFATFFALLGDGKMVTWNRLQTVKLFVDYDFLLSEKWSIGARYKFDFIHSSRPRNLLSYQNTFFVYGAFKF